MNETAATLEQLVDLYLDRCHLGDAPDLVTFATEHPAHTAELLEILPLLNDLEKAGDAARGRSRAPQDELPELPGSDFRLNRKIGGGGMGVVFEGRQLSLNRRVAVKLLAPSLVADAKRRTQFEDEARIVAMLHHPNIVKVIAAGQNAGICYYVMELVDGERLDKHAFHSLREIAQAGLQTAQALAYAHGCQVMHRDIKPSNLILDASGIVHVADFGLACVLENGHASVERAGAQNGTLRYMPAERLLHGVSSFAGDLYALGVTLYELIAKRPVLQEHSPNALFRRICKEPLPPLECEAEPDFAAIVNKCISFDAKDRYPSMQELCEDLRRFLDNEPVSAAPSPAGRRFMLWIRRKPAVAALTGVAAACAVTAVAALATGYIRTNTALDRAERNASLASAALSGVFAHVEHQSSSRRDTELLTELMPYYGELARRRDMSPEKVAEANRVLGTCAFRTGNYFLAEKAFRRVVETQPDADARIMLANALRRQGNDEAAESMFRNVAEAFSESPYPADRYAAVQAIRELNPDKKSGKANLDDLQQAYYLITDLLKADPNNPDYRYQYAALLGTAPDLAASNGVPRAVSAATQILNRLAGEYPDRPDYGLALAELVDGRLHTAKPLRGSERLGILAALERADRLLARHPNMPDVVSAVLRLRVSYTAYLRRIGDETSADRETARTSGMLEMLASSREPPEAQRFRHNGSNGVNIAYRQISINHRLRRAPATLVTILHGSEGVGSDNARQLQTPSLFPLVEYIQSHSEKVIILLPQCPAKKSWTVLRASLDELIQKKAREFRVPAKRIHEIGEAPLSEDELLKIFPPLSTASPAKRPVPNETESADWNCRGIEATHP